jgi:hypothetical protein
MKNYPHLFAIAAFAILLTSFFYYQSSISKNTSKDFNTSPQIAIQSASNSSCKYKGPLPDPSCTPGSNNPNINQDNISQTICNRNWSTKSIRPPVSYTDNLKKQQLTEYGASDTNLRDYEEDHLIPLEVGGNPTDPKNLWPEPRQGSPNASNKDRLENYLHDKVCSGKISLQEAQQEISIDWVKYWSLAGLK